MHFYLKSIVGPASKLHITILVIEGEPSDINLTGGFEYSRRNISTPSLVGHHDVSWESSIKLLISAEMDLEFYKGENGVDQYCSKFMLLLSNEFAKFYLV